MANLYSTSIGKFLFPIYTVLYVNNIFDNSNRIMNNIFTSHLPCLNIIYELLPAIPIDKYNAHTATIEQTP